MPGQSAEEGPDDERPAETGGDGLDGGEQKAYEGSPGTCRPSLGRNPE